jgi:hypothetical protein
VRTAVREVAQPIAYLASPQAASITGADFLIDGGLAKTAWRRRPGEGGPGDDGLVKGGLAMTAW